MLCFQLGELATLIPSTNQPPGQRTKAGCNPAVYWAMSLRNPLRRLLNVFTGNNDTTSSHTLPVLPNDNTNFALGSDCVAVKLHTYFSHSLFVHWANV